MEGGCSIEQLAVNATSELVGNLTEKLGEGNMVVKQLNSQVNRQKRKIGALY